jgi:hypothetical protein
VRRNTGRVNRRLVPLLLTAPLAVAAARLPATGAEAVLMWSAASLLLGGLLARRRRVLTAAD